jgi:hypothetical protein
MTSPPDLLIYTTIALELFSNILETLFIQKHCESRIMNNHVAHASPNRSFVPRNIIAKIKLNQPAIQQVLLHSLETNFCNLIC